VTAAYGVERVHAGSLEAFEKYGTERVLIAYDRRPRRATVPPCSWRRS